jgi:plasmid stabilization system protein ParE
MSVNSRVSATVSWRRSAPPSTARHWPNTFPPVLHNDNGDVIERRIAVVSFPYSVRYRIGDSRLVVLAVYHQRRRPGLASDRRP